MVELGQERWTEPAAADMSPHGNEGEQATQYRLILGEEAMGAKVTGKVMPSKTARDATNIGTCFKDGDIRASLVWQPCREQAGWTGAQDAYSHVQAPSEQPTLRAVHRIMGDRIVRACCPSAGMLRSMPWDRWQEYATRLPQHGPPGEM
jgi:hypothetical protein